jgi:hypothetical protein
MTVEVEEWLPILSYESTVSNVRKEKHGFM